MMPAFTNPFSSAGLHSLKLLILLAFLLLPGFPAPAQPSPELPEHGVIRTEEMRDTAFVRQMLQEPGIQTLCQSDPDSAVRLMESLLELSSRSSYMYGTALSLYYLGSAYGYLSRNEESEYYLRRAAPYTMAIPEAKKFLPNICGNLGRIYQIRGDFTTAAAFYRQGIILYENHFSPDDAAYLYSNFASLLLYSGRPAAIINYYLDKAIQTAEKKEDYFILSNSLINKGAVFNASRNWDSSRFYFNEAYQIAVRHGYNEVVYLALINLGITSLEQNAPSEAVAYLQQAEEMSHVSNQIDLSYRHSQQTALGAAYVRLGAYRKAEPVLLKSLEQARQLGQRLVIREAHWQLSSLYDSLGNYPAAYRHARAYISMNDSMAGEEIIRSINHTEVRFRTAEKEKEIAEKQLRIITQERNIKSKNLWISVLVSAVLLITLLTIGITRLGHTRRQLLLKEFYNLQQQQEINRLKATVQGEENERKRIAGDLHDGIGGLIAAAQMNASMLEGAVRDTDAYRELRNILDSIGNEVRKTAHNMLPEILLHNGLPEAVNHFCHQLAMSHGIRIDIQNYGDFSALNDHYSLSVYRIIQELLHNVVKHAEATRVLVQVLYEEPVLSITVEDNGKGFDAGQGRRAEGAGLTSLQTRVSSMNGTLSIRSSPGKGTSIYIETDTSIAKESPENTTFQHKNN